MGLAKDEWLAAQERGWSTPDKVVCFACVEDPHLRRLIEEAADSMECDYCGRKDQGDAIAAPVEIIMPAVMNALNYHFREPADAGVPYESAEGGYLIEPDNTVEALMSLPLECHDELFDDIASAIAHYNDGWVAAAGGHWASIHANQELLFAWERFSEHVRHRQRFFFSLSRSKKRAPWEDREIEPHNLMPSLADLLSRLGLIRPIKADTELTRVRLRSSRDTWSLDAGSLGAPPPDKALAGRMNPAGISYLYLALERETAIAETVKGPPALAAVGRFGLAREPLVLDLVTLPAVPSVFDEEQRREREYLIFLHQFVKAIARPVEKDGLEHVDYVPSQVVCEYFASVYRHKQERRLDGILYPSAVRPGGSNLVLFPNHESFDDRFALATFRDAEELHLPDWAALTAAVSA